MPLFLEPSAWVKLYVSEEGTDSMKALIARPDLVEDGFFASRTVALEMYGRMGKALRRGEEEIAEHLSGEVDKRRRRQISRRIRKGHRRKYMMAVEEFDRDFPARINNVEIDEQMYEQAIRLAHARPDRSVAPMDWLHLATALQLSKRLRSLGLPYNVILVTSDAPLRTCAIEQGMDVFDPCSDAPSEISPPKFPL